MIVAHLFWWSFNLLIIFSILEHRLKSLYSNVLIKLRDLEIKFPIFAKAPLNVDFWYIETKTLLFLQLVSKFTKTVSHFFKFRSKSNVLCFNASKYGWIDTLLYKRSNLYFNKGRFHQGINTSASVFKNDGNPENFIDLCIKNFLNKLFVQGKVPHIKYIGGGTGGFLHEPWNILGNYWWAMKYFWILESRKKFSYGRLDNRNLKFFKKYSIIAQFKALNERISEWAYFFKFGQAVPEIFIF